MVNLYGIIILIGLVTTDGSKVKFFVVILHIDWRIILIFSTQQLVDHTQKGSTEELNLIDIFGLLGTVMVVILVRFYVLKLYKIDVY